MGESSNIGLGSDTNIRLAPPVRFSSSLEYQRIPRAGSSWPVEEWANQTADLDRISYACDKIEKMICNKYSKICMNVKQYVISCYISFHLDDLGL